MLVNENEARGKGWGGPPLSSRPVIADWLTPNKHEVALGEGAQLSLITTRRALFCAADSYYEWWLIVSRDGSMAPS